MCARGGVWGAVCAVWRGCGGRAGGRHAAGCGWGIAVDVGGSQRGGAGADHRLAGSRGGGRSGPEGGAKVHEGDHDGRSAAGHWGGGGGGGGGGAWGDAVRGRDGGGGGGGDRPAAGEARTAKARLAVAYEAGGGLSVTVDEAAAVDAGTARRLLSERRLSLVLDLDHTLVHATDDPRAAADVAAVVGGAPPGGLDGGPDGGCGVDDVAAAGIHALCLVDANGHPSRPMHVKLRPGLAAFLAAARVAFELHIYTMGTRRYAAAVASLLDGGDGSLFRGRVTSREDFGEGALNRKNLRRVFPCDDSMVLIVDDRDDVWLAPPRSPGSDGGGGVEPMRNLVKARPYMFWNGFADVYSREEPAGGAAGKGGGEGGAAAPAGAPAGATSASAPGISATRPDSATAAVSVLVASDPKSASTSAGDAAAAAGSNAKAETTSGQGNMKVAANGEAKFRPGLDDMKVDATGEVKAYSGTGDMKVAASGEAKTSSDTGDMKVVATGGSKAAPENEERVVISDDAAGVAAPESTAAPLPPNTSAERERVLATWSRADAEDDDHLGKLLAVLMEAHRRFFVAADAAMPPLPTRSRPSSPAGTPSPSSPSESPPGVLRPGAAAPAPRAFKRPRRAPSPGLGRSIGGAALPPPAIKPAAALVSVPHPCSLSRPGSPGGVPGMPWRVPADVKDVLDTLRRETLRGVRLTMTGVYPSPLPSEGAGRGSGSRTPKLLSHAPIRERASAGERARHAAALAILARTQPLAAAAVRAGATVDATFSATATTHVVANPIRGRETDKSRRARALGGVFIVTTAWLRASLDNWARAPELPYALYPPPPGAPGGGPATAASGAGRGGAAAPAAVASAATTAGGGGDKSAPAGRRAPPSAADVAKYAATIRAARATRLADAAAREAAARSVRDGRAAVGGSAGAYRSASGRGGGHGGGARYGVPAGRDGAPGGGGSKRTYGAVGGGGPLSAAGRVPVTAAKPPTPDRRPSSSVGGSGGGGGGMSDLDDFAARLESELLADQSGGK
ncbi:hypothetical protein I4F81_005932 [Pyropia yezoensis]|uniref:Uncharacterized protein n=1 Tax=Pyropia yezoensis TaxID=2788 RepID=A0ACC3BZN8_PYRYE|nr:hypothetical protein I4F81_005932 [Neopyropia yezoensis]